MVAVSNADRIVFPEVQRTKGDVVAYYERIAPRLLAHVEGRPVSIKRFPKGLAGAGFFQKNVPPHYPASIARVEIPRSKAAAKMHPRKGAKDQEVTVYPLVDAAEQLAYLANQGAIELHVPTARIPELARPDRIVIDLDPPAGAVGLVRRAAFLAREALGELGLRSVPVATGSKGYHVVAPITPTVDVEALSETLQKLAALLAEKHPAELTAAFRVAARKGRVFVDWLRNRHSATVVVPYGLRARPRASVAVPLSWEEIESTDPDAFTIADLERLLDRPDPLGDLAAAPSEPEPFVRGVDQAFERSGLVLETFARFRS